MKQARKKHLLKRLAAFTAALAIAVAMTVPALAANIPSSGEAKVITTDGVVNIPKTLKVTNPVLTEVAGPGLQLTYTLAPASVTNAVIDDGTNTATVHAGPADGLTLTSSPSYSVSELLTASESGAANVKNIVLTADLTKFTEPGVYRYTLTDTTTSDALSAAGVVRNAAFTNVRYVDVYIQRDEQTQNLVVEGYVVGSDNDGNEILVKETFDTSTTTDGAGAVTTDTPDVFNTYNVILRKQVSGAMGDRHNQFPFAITLTDSGRAFYAAKGTAPASSTQTNQNARTTALSTTLAHEEVYYIAGLRANDTVAYTETNNTTDTYSVSITGGTPVSASNVAPNGTKSMQATAAPSAGDVTFNNSHGSVSPTGVLMRFGPYIGMVVIAGLIVALGISTKNKKKKEAK